MDQVQVDGGYIFINDLNGDDSKGIFVFLIDVYDTEVMSVTVIDQNFLSATSPFQIMSFEILPTLDMTSDKILIADKYMRFYAFDYKTVIPGILKGEKPNKSHEVWMGSLLDQLMAQMMFFTD